MVRRFMGVSKRLALMVKRSRGRVRSTQFTTERDGKRYEGVVDLDGIEKGGIVL